MMIYMYAVPMAFNDPEGLGTGGEIHYPGRIQRVPQGGLDQGFIQRLIELICRIANDEPPQPVPSARECAMCDITAADCPKRVDQSQTAGNNSTDESDSRRRAPKADSRLHSLRHSSVR